MFFLQEKFWRPVKLQPDPLVSLATHPLRSLAVAPTSRREEQSSVVSRNQCSSSEQLPSVLALGPGRDIKQLISNTSHLQHLNVTSAQVRTLSKPCFRSWGGLLQRLFLHFSPKKSRIRETKNLSTNVDSSTNTTVGWTKNTQKPK